jgi:hypothetical protein
MSRPSHVLRVQLAGVTRAAMEAKGGYWTAVWNVFDGQVSEMSLVNAHGTVSECVFRWMFVTSRHHDRFRVAAARLLGSRSSSISLTKPISGSRRPKRISIA